MNFKAKLIYLLLLCTLPVFSQVEINNDLIFTNPVDSANQFYNVSNARDSAEALVNKQFYNNELYLSSACNGSIVQLTSGIPLNSYKDGMSFEFVFPDCITESPNIYLNINTLGNIKFNMVGQHDSIKYLEGKVIKILIYNNEAFFIPGSKINKCPAGFVKINQNYCISINRKAKATFWDAIMVCSNLDSHLCTPEEWITACLNHKTLLVKMPLNWEWVDSGSNHNIHAPILGEPNCTNIYTETTATTGLPHFYRCCYKLK